MMYLGSQDYGKSSFDPVNTETQEFGSDDEELLAVETVQRNAPVFGSPEGKLERLKQRMLDLCSDSTQTRALPRSERTSNDFHSTEPSIYNTDVLDNFAQALNTQPAELDASPFQEAIQLSYLEALQQLQRERQQLVDYIDSVVEERTQELRSRLQTVLETFTLPQTLRADWPKPELALLADWPGLDLTIRKVHATHSRKLQRVSGAKTPDGRTKHTKSPGICLMSRKAAGAERRVLHRPPGYAKSTVLGPTQATAEFKIPQRPQRAIVKHGFGQ